MYSSNLGQNADVDWGQHQCKYVLGWSDAYLAYMVCETCLKVRTVTL